MLEIHIVGRHDPGFEERLIALFRKHMVKINYISLYNISFKNPRKYIEKLSLLSRIPKDSNIIVVSRIDKYLPLILSSIAGISPSFLLLVIPPDPHHDSSSRNIALLSAINLSLSRLSAKGTYILMGYTTPRERLLFGKILDKYDHIFIPLYTWEEEKIIEEIPIDPPKILLIGDHVDHVFLTRLISVLEEVGVAPLIILGLKRGNVCPSTEDYRIICVKSESFNGVISKLTVVITMGQDHVAAEILAKAIGCRRPVITSKKQGIAWVYEGTGLILYSASFDPESIASKILELLNKIDRYKQASLRADVHPPKPHRTIEYLLSLIERL